MTSFSPNGEKQSTPSRLLDRLNQARHEQFVGRKNELNTFKTALTAAELPFFVLYVFGPGGVGKTSLLREFGYLCTQAQVPVTYVDMRDVQPSPEAFVNALRLAMELSATDSPIKMLAAQSDRHVIMIDTYEILAPLNGWLRRVFLPQLSENVLLVLAGRDPFPPSWQADPGWSALIRMLALRNFNPEESQTFLARRGIPAEHHQLILEFTYGHPLALSLIADEFAQRGDLLGDSFPDAAPDIIKTLLDRFVQEVPSALHRVALEACAQVRLTTEPLLAAMLAIPDGRDLFEWLRGLSFVESGPHGIFLHDLAGRALAIDLRWRNAELHDKLLQRARAYYTSRLQQGDIEAQQRIIVDYIYLHRHNPVVQPFFESSEGVVALADRARDSDWSALTAMVARHEGEQSARLAADWFRRQPQEVLVMRGIEADPESAPLGFMMSIAVQATSPEALNADPATQAAWKYLQTHAPLRSGEKASLFRYWMARDTYQAISPVQSLIGVNMIRHYLTTPGLAFTFFSCADPDFWAPLCAYAGLTRLSEADFEVGGRHYGVYGHDWRVVPPLKWLDIMAARETMRTPPPASPPPAAATVVVLSQPEFAKAVHDVFRNLLYPEALHNSPLLRSRLVVKSIEANLPAAKKVERLRNLVRTATESLQASPRGVKFYRALYHTYLNPVPTQEQAAELLDLPYSTFRRHLKAGITEVTSILWQQEIGVLPDRI